MRKILAGIIIGIIGTVTIVSIFDNWKNKKADTNLSGIEERENALQETENPNELDNSFVSITECIDDMTRKIGVISYERGSILVSFKKGTTYSDALSILSAFGLSEKKIHEKELTFDNNPWLSVDVPAGQEISIACKVREHSNVTYSYVNSILELHE